MGIKPRIRMVKHEHPTCHDSHEGGTARSTACGCTARGGKRNLQRRTYVLTRFHSRGPKLNSTRGSRAHNRPTRSPTPLPIAAFHRCKSAQRLPPRTTSGEGRGGGRESKRETPPRQRDDRESVADKHCQKQLAL
ncbi:hypothetical protein HZU73_03384 [Apis mellifera caucasica]|nr:hypothetical protein HZU73_03384 [Apis mellifera caucasica]